MISREISLGFISVDRVELAAVQLGLEVEGQLLSTNIAEENEWRHVNTQDLMTGSYSSDCLDIKMLLE